MEPHRLRAPSSDGALLAEQPLDQAGERLDSNVARLNAWDYDFQGRAASRLRPMVRAQVLERSRAFLASAGLELPGPAATNRLVVTGHQPELFHPGVWVKNFAASEIARRTGASALNIIVDNDIPKSTGLKVPVRDGRSLRTERIFFDEWGGEVPYEDLPVNDETLFASFPERVKAVYRGTDSRILLDEFWPQALRYRGHTDRLGLRFALARRAVEGSWGVRNHEVPLSQICETEGFLWFACHLLAHLPRFQEVHNAALRRYRSLYHIRSRHHPVPALGGQGDWLEAPFWAWRAGNARRRPLLARQRAGVIDLRLGGESEAFLEIPLGPERDACCAVEALQGLPAQGVRLRTRALTTTMFSRYLLGDLFLHGIGGAKYDELGDEVSLRFFGLKPPDYLTMSLTLWLGLEDDPATPPRLASVNRELRDLDFNPDRHISSSADAEVVRRVEAKRRAIAGPVETHPQRLERFHEIRRCNAGLQALVSGRREALRRERAALSAGVASNAVARNREYSLVLHSRSRIREALRRSLPGLRLSGGG